MKRRILAFLGVLLTVFVGTAVFSPTQVGALAGGDCGAGTPLGFRAWYAGLCTGNNDTDEIAEIDKNNENELIQFVWTIILNVLFDLLIAVGYLALGFVIYGGYLYIMSQGDPSKLAKGKRTLSAAIIGTIIAMVASIAVNTIRVILGINTADQWAQHEFTQADVQGAFTWAYSVAGIIAVIFIVKGALDYLLSSGDPAKTRKATQSIIYAVVGLVVVLLAALITNFVITSTGGALEQ